MGERQPVSIGPLTGNLKPKYRIISEVLGRDYIPYGGLDVFLDFNTIISAASNYKKFLNGMLFQEHVDVDIISSILTTFKHWKDYTRKWDNVRIIGFVNDFDMEGLAEASQLKSYLIPYVNKFRQDRFNQLTYYWNEALKMVETILKYVPGMYLIRCKRFDSYMIPNVIDDYANNHRDRLIVSGNSLLTNYQFSDRTKVIYSCFQHHGVAQLTAPLMIVQSITKIDEEVMSEFIKNKVCYNLLNVIVGDYERGIIGLPQASVTSIAYAMLRCMERHEIPDDPKSVESVLPAIDKSYHSYITQSYPLVDVDMHTQLVPKSMIEKMKEQMIDLYDVDGLNSINIDGLNLLELL